MNGTKHTTLRYNRRKSQDSASNLVLAAKIFYILQDDALRLRFFDHVHDRLEKVALHVRIVFSISYNRKIMANFRLL